MMPSTTTNPIITLASGSPRRAELLQQIGVPFLQRPVDLDETPLAGEAPFDYVQRLALAKARAGWQQSLAQGDNLPVLGADTSVVLNNRIMGKPADVEESVAMLEALSGNTHQVLTAISLVNGEQQLSALVSSDVTFRQLDREEILAYWQTGEPTDKAGSYAIQGLGAVFVSQLSGSYSAVVGLPLLETWQLLKKMDAFK
jgi:septum formation protein